MKILKLGYLGVEAARPEAWATFAADILGAPPGPAGPDGTRTVRLDARSYRLAIHPGGDGRLSYLGWELGDRAALAAACGELDAAGVAYTSASDTLCRTRGVEAMVRLEDPEGHPLELFYGGASGAEPLAPTSGVSGFVALGHVALGIADWRAAERFYTGVLGLKVSDYIAFPYGATEITAVFLRCADGREHSLALQNLGLGLDHIMIEVAALDDVGHALDRCLAAGVPVTETLGRHTNDGVVSFYMVGPSGFQVEYGWGGIHVDDASWRIRHMTSASEWGHHVMEVPGQKPEAVE
jgi:3,4-dihydroxy-9,10-secoandrosta-1,3,5(10)-triene-9,17-dione 4,5-dioxygenase